MHAAADPDMLDVTLIAWLGEADCAVRICHFYDFCPAVVVQYCECDQDIGSEEGNKKQQRTVTSSVITLKQMIDKLCGKKSKRILDPT